MINQIIQINQINQNSLLIRGQRRQGCRRAAPALPTPSACGRPSVDRDARSSHAHQPGGSATTPAVHSFFRGKRGLGRRARAPAPLAAPSTLLLAAVGPAARQSALYLSGTPGSGPAHIFARLAGPAGLIAPPVRVPSARSPRAAASGPPLCPPRASSAFSPRPPGRCRHGRLAHHGLEPSAPRRARLELPRPPRPARPGAAGLVVSPIAGPSHRLPDAPASGLFGLLASPSRASPAVASPITGLSHRLPAVPDSGSPPRPPRLALPGVAGASPRPSRACAIGSPPGPPRAPLPRPLASPFRASSASRRARLLRPGCLARHRAPHRRLPAVSTPGRSSAAGLVGHGDPEYQGPMQLPRRQDRCDIYGRRGSTSLPLAGPL